MVGLKNQVMSVVSNATQATSQLGVMCAKILLLTERFIWITSSSEGAVFASARTKNNHVPLGRRQSD